MSASHNAFGNSECRTFMKQGCTRGASLFSCSKINSVANDSAFSFVRTRQNLRASFQKRRVFKVVFFSSNTFVKDTRRNWIPQDRETARFHRNLNLSFITTKCLQNSAVSSYFTSYSLNFDCIWLIHLHN